MAEQSANSKLNPTGGEIRAEVVPLDPKAINVQPGESPALEADATKFVEAVLATQAQDDGRLAQVKATADALALDTQKAAARQSDMLKQPIKTLAARSEDGGEVANALVEL